MAEVSAEPATRASTGKSPGRQPALDHAVAMRLAAVKHDRVLTQLRSLKSSDWSLPTDCPAWDVRALACHMLGMAEMAASVREQMRQTRQTRKASRADGVFIDA